MKLDKTVKKETWHIFTGTLAGSVLVGLAFLIIGKFDYTVALGLLLGTLTATLNFLLLGITVQKSLSMGEKAKAFLQRSYTFRNLLYVAAAILSFTIKHFNSLATIIPFFIPRIVILVMQFTGKYKPDEFKEEIDKAENEGKES